MWLQEDGIPALITSDQDLYFLAQVIQFCVHLTFYFLVLGEE